MSKGEHKRGALSNEEKLTIRRMTEDGKSVREICSVLNRNPDPILKYISKSNLVIVGADEDTIERTNLKNKLMSRHYWSDIKLQFNDNAGELDYFIDSWISYMVQFGEDTTYSEEMAIKDVITIDILISRSMRERNMAVQYIETLQKQYDKLVKLNDPEDVVEITHLEEQINIVRSSLSSYTVEYTKLLDKKKDLNRDLKMTRDQRVKKIEDSPTTYGTYIKMLEDEDVRKRTGEQIEMMKVAKNKAKKKFGDLHIFGDGRGDLPFLTPELYEDYITREEREKNESGQENNAKNQQDETGIESNSEDN